MSDLPIQPGLGQPEQGQTPADFWTHAHNAWDGLQRGWLALRSGVQTLRSSPFAPYLAEGAAAAATALDRRAEGARRDGRGALAGFFGAGAVAMSFAEPYFASGPNVQEHSHGDQF